MTRDDLILGNLALVAWTARSFRPRTRERREELDSAGMLGLVRAADGFDPGMGIRFASYAHPAIWRAMVDAARKDTLIVARAGQSVRVTLLGAKVEDPAADFREWAQRRRETGWHVEAAGRALAGLRRLPARERGVVEARLGLDGGEPLTLDAVGRTLRVTRERARQIEARGLREIRRMAGAGAA